MYYYLRINFSDVISECRRLHPDNDFVFMQDSAPSHRAKATQNFLQDNTVDFISSQEWTPHSPDLKPLDYSQHTDFNEDTTDEGASVACSNIRL